MTNSMPVYPASVHRGSTVECGDVVQIQDVVSNAQVLTAPIHNLAGLQNSGALIAEWAAGSALDSCASSLI